MTLSGYLSKEVRVNYSATGGTAVNGTDFTLAAGTLTFAPGETGKKIIVALPGGIIFKPDLTLEISLAAPVNSELGTPAKHVLTIDNMAPPPTIGFASPTSAGAEAVTHVAIPVVLSNPTVSRSR